MDDLTNRHRFKPREINRRVTKISYIHEEIIEEILMRLPVKSVARFKCVSKSWRSLIDDKRFIKAHINKSSADPSFTNHKVITNLDHVQQWSLPSLLHDPYSSTPVECKFPTYNTDEASKFVGCCDGLVCILIGSKDFILWNATTKEFNLLPSVIPNYIKLVSYGFGYDEHSDDYKVFGLLGGNKTRGIVKVYSLKTDSWRMVANNITIEYCPLVVNRCGKFLCGKLHWIRRTVTTELEVKWDVSSFDLEKECYGTLELPNCGEEFYIPFVGVLEGSLYLVCDYIMARYDVWVLKEYNVRDSWHKMATIPYPCDSLNMDPLFVGGNGEILLVCDDSFVVYRMRDARFSRPRLINLGMFRGGVHVYVESLVSVVPAVWASRTTDEMMKLRLIAES